MGRHNSSVDRRGFTLKRCADFALAVIAALVSLPVFVLVAVAVWLSLGRPIFFRQDRAGLNAKPFRLIKFRTMSDSRDARGELLPDGERLGKLGELLRSSSLDELPEILNILRGEMSFVGPRPLLLDYLPLYSEYHARRHEVRPGLTGLAQISGRNEISWKERLDLDVEYVDRQSLLLDLRILVATVGKVIRREGVRAKDSATMERFDGRV